MPINDLSLYIIFIGKIMVRGKGSMRDKKKVRIFIAYFKKSIN